MSHWPEHIAAQTWHGRAGGIRNEFTYGVDYLLVDMEATAGPHPGPLLFSRNRFNLYSVQDRHHGGPRGAGAGLAWARDVFASRGFVGQDGGRIALLAQPGCLGYSFNPVSFWLLLHGEALHAVIAEVNNTFGDRHSYFCAKPDGSAIHGSDGLASQKIFHVSPFQSVSGSYVFHFSWSATALAFRIALTDGAEGVVATLTGKRVRASSAGLLMAALRRPFGALRVVALIHWQAVKLKIKGASYRPRPLPPMDEVS